MWGKQTKKELDSFNGWLIEAIFKQMYYHKLLFKVNKNSQRDWKLELSK